MQLIIGNKNYSSWSLRPWLALKMGGIEFTEQRIPLYTPHTKAEILRHSPSGKVPALIDGGLAIWDSLAICEYLAELKPALWPADRAARAMARSVSAEMHSGFAALRQQLPMDIRRSEKRTPSPEAQADIDRIVGIWNDCRARFAASGGAGGGFLFGAFSIADAMYAPICFRFKSYAVPVSGAAAAWVDTMLALPAMREWEADARGEAEEIKV